MNIDINIVVREYEQTIRELSVRLVNLAIEKAAMQDRINALEKPTNVVPIEKKE